MCRWLRGAAHRRSFCPDSCRKAQVVRRHSCSRLRAFSTEPYFLTKKARLGELSISSPDMYHGAARSEGIEAPPPGPADFEAIAGSKARCPALGSAPCCSRTLGRDEATSAQRELGALFFVLTNTRWEHDTSSSGPRQTHTHPSVQSKQHAHPTARHRRGACAGGAHLSRTLAILSPAARMMTERPKFVAMVGIAFVQLAHIGR